jgi:DNA-binding NtrC family response regulator
VKPALLIVDDEESVRESFRLVLQDDYDLAFAEDAKTTLRALKTQSFNLCLLDIMLPDGSGLDLLRQMKRRDESIDVIMVTALQGFETGLDAMKGKAQDYITKPFKIDELRGLIKRVLAKQSLKQEKHSVRSEINEPKPLCLRGSSQAVQALAKKIKTVASSETPICIIGERGSGVEEVTRQIHKRSSRAHGPFVTLNCSNPSERQLERELFGEETQDKLTQVSKLEFADKGTLYLKQVDRLPLHIQDKFMAILSKETIFQPERMPVTLDIRVIASSEMDLTSKFAKRFFRKDFYRFIHGFVFLYLL